MKSRSPVGGNQKWPIQQRPIVGEKLHVVNVDADDLIVVSPPPKKGPQNENGQVRSSSHVHVNSPCLERPGVTCRHGIVGVESNSDGPVGRKYPLPSTVNFCAELCRVLGVTSCFGKKQRSWRQKRDNAFPVRPRLGVGAIGWIGSSMRRGCGRRSR